MNSALWTLLGLQLFSYLRFFLRSLQTVKGALLAGVGLLFLIPYLAVLVFAPSGNQPIDPDLLRQNGPPILLVYCLIQVLFSANQSSLYFTPAEVQFLFSGPFTRRQILLYKITLMTLLTLPLPLLFAFFLRQHAGSWLAATLAMTLGILFLSLFTIAVNLLIDTLGSALYNRARSMLWLGLLLLVGVGVYLAGGITSWDDLGMQGATLSQTPLVQTICWPLSWFFELFLARQIYPDLALALVMSLLVDFALLMVVFSLDRNLLEVAAANSERMYTMIQQMRRGQSALAVGGGTATWSLPDFPYLGGVGPIFWRQLMQAIRGFKRLVVILVMVGIFATLGMLTNQGVSDVKSSLIGSAVTLLVMMTAFLTMLVPYDFRGDIDALPMLKSFPIHPWALVVGQLLTPTLITTLFHWGVLGGMSMVAVYRGIPLPPQPILVLAILFPVFNFMMYAIENLLFLIFPVRILQATPGDFQSFGRNILLTFGKMFLVGLVLAFAALLAVPAYFFLGQNVALAVAVAWVVIATAGLVLIPAVALAFASFDVGRDTPP